MGRGVFPARDQQHLFLQDFGRFVLVPGQIQEVQKHMKTNNTLQRFSQIIQSSKTTRNYPVIWGFGQCFINFIYSH